MERLAAVTPDADTTAGFHALTPYTAWVVGHDLPWLYQLWKLNQPE